jgi:hypothetical protein
LGLPEELPVQTQYVLNCLSVDSLKSQKTQQKTQQGSGSVMAGSIRLVRAPDTWELRVYLGRDSEKKVRHVHRRFRGTRKAAERELRRLVAEQEIKPAPVPEDTPEWGADTTINQAIAAWRANGWGDLSPSVLSACSTENS